MTTKKVLIIDDEVEVCQSLGVLLDARFKVNLDFAHDIKEGQEALSKGPFDLIICDYNLPHGNGARLLYDAVQDEDTAWLKETTIIFISGIRYIEMAPDLKLMDEFDNCHLRNKPILSDDLFQLAEGSLS